MKYSAFLVILSIAIFTSACKDKNPFSQKPTGERTAIANASSGLVMRAQPERAAAKLRLISKGEVVTIVEEGDKDITIDNITSKWFRVQHQGITGWVFGGYLKFDAAAPAEKGETLLAEEQQGRAYIGKEFTDFVPATKSKILTMAMTGNNSGYTVLKYVRRSVVILHEKIGEYKSAPRWRVTDVLDLKEEQGERIFVRECKSQIIKGLIVAIANEPADDNCEYAAISQAWSVENGKFSPAMAQGLTCKPECCKDKCD